MIRCIIVDDEQHAIDLLTDHVSKLSMLDLQFATTSAVQACQYLCQHKTDLVFLDIQMPELDGMQMLKILKGKSKAILTTAYSEYALEGYEYDVIDYLLKPIVFERFLQAVGKATDLLSVSPVNIPSYYNELPASDDFIFVKTEGRNKMLKVLLQEIEYIEAIGNYLAIHTVSARIICLLTMKELQEKLPAQQFIRIHKSYIVPVKKITEVQGNQLQIGKRKFTIGDVYRKPFLNAIEKYIIKDK